MDQGPSHKTWHTETNRKETGEDPWGHGHRGKEDSLFNKWCWFNCSSTCRRLRIDSRLSPCAKLNSKWIKDLHIKPDTLKLIEKKLGKTFEDMGTREKFLNRTPITYALRSRIDKWDLIKLQSFCKAKDTIDFLILEHKLLVFCSGTSPLYQCPQRSSPVSFLLASECLALCGGPWSIWIWA